MINTITNILKRELIYIWFSFEEQFAHLFWFWLIGAAVGSLVSVFARDRIHGLFARMSGSRLGVFGIVPACLLGIASPLCVFGTLPIAADFSRRGMRDDWLAAFMMASVLLNPQLIIYSAALGTTALTVRIISGFLCGCAAGLVVHFVYRNKPFFNFSGLGNREHRDTHPNPFIRYLKDFGRNVKATAIYFLLGVLLAVLFQLYVPRSIFTAIFGGNQMWGVLLAAAIGLLLYSRRSGMIPLLRVWMFQGMNMGSAAAFMITGPATKIIKPGALKNVLGARRFVLYILFVTAFAILTGLVINTTVSTCLGALL